MNLSIETEIDVKDLIDQVLCQKDCFVVLDSILDNMEEGLSAVAGDVFSTNCHQLIKQIDERVNPEVYRLEEDGDSEEEE